MKCETCEKEITEERTYHFYDHLASKRMIPFCKNGDCFIEWCAKRDNLKTTQKAVLTLLADKKNAAAFFNSPEALQFCAEVLLTNGGFVERLANEFYAHCKLWKYESLSCKENIIEAIKKASNLEGEGK